MNRLPSIVRQHIAGLRLLLVFTVLTGIIYPVVMWGIAQVAFNHQANGSMVSFHGRVVGSSLLCQEFLDAKGNPLVQYFQPRPSAAVPSPTPKGDYGCDPTFSSASNYGPNNPLLSGFVPGVNTVGLNGSSSAVNPFATKADPYCVPQTPQGVPVISPSPGEKFAKNADGSYVCDPNTIPERQIAYRAFNNLPAGTQVPPDAVTASASGLDPDISPANAYLQVNRVAAARHVSPAAIQALVNQYTQGRTLGFLGEQRVDVLNLNIALDEKYPMP
jgi:potassium-transporting ATPase KdpC subunit